MGQRLHVYWGPQHGLREKRSRVGVRVDVDTRLSTSTDLQVGLPKASLGFVATVSTVGLVLVSHGYALARSEASGAQFFYWFGLATLYLPIAWAALSRGYSRLERFLLAMLFGANIFGIRYLYQPIWFSFADELQHLRTLTDILGSQVLFTHNPALPISPYFPGLELVAAALIDFTGVTPFIAGVILAVVAKLVTVAALYWLFESVSGSSLMAMIAVVIYAANPHFVHFGSIFAYGTLAFPLLIASLALVQAWTVSTKHENGLMLFGALALLALTMTHHLTSFITVGILSLWSLVAIRTRAPGEARLRPLFATAFLVVSIVAWHAVTGATTWQYLGMILSDAAETLTGSMEITATPPPIQRPLGEFVLGALTVMGIGVLLPFGLRRSWRSASAFSLVRTLLILSLVFYVSILARFLPKGDELAGRLWNFSYVGIAFTLASIFGLFANRGIALRLTGAFAMLGLFLGGVTLGYPAHWARLPGPFLVSAFERSVDLHGVATALWESAHLPEDARLGADFTGLVLGGGYGRMDPVLDIPDVILADNIGQTELERLDQASVKYLYVDERLCSSTPTSGFYVSVEEANAFFYETPLSCEAISKFDESAALVRIFDDGVVRIYEVAEHAFYTALEQAVTGPE